MVGNRALLLPLAFALGLAGLAFLDPVRQNPKVLWAFLGAAAAVVRVERGAVRSGPSSGGRTLTLEVVLRKQHYLQACAQGSVLLYWGWYWPPVYSFAPFILAQLVFAYAFDMLLVWSRRDTYTSRLRSVSGHLQHQPVPLVQAGLVLSAVRDGGARVGGERADSLEQGRTARAHLQSVVVSAGGVFAGPARHRHERHHLGPEHRDHAVLSAADVPDAVSHRPAGAILLRRNFDDHVGRGGDLRVRPPLLRRDGHLFLLRFVYSDCRLSGDASAVQRSVHFTAHRAGAHHLRRALRAEHVRVVPVAGQRGNADVLRQASASPALEFVGQVDRSRCRADR